MKIERGEIWLANLDPTQGSEQAGTQPIIIFQNSTLSKFTTTIITIPFTTNLRRATLPTCLILLKGQGGLNQDSVALCHQIGCIPLWQPGKYGLMSRPIEVLNFKPLPNEYNYSMSKLGCTPSNSCP